MRISDWSSDVCSSDLPDSPEPDEAQEARTAKRRKLLRILAIVVAAVALLWGIWYFLTQAGRVSTDNAYVGADSATVTALVPGPVRSEEHTSELQSLMRISYAVFCLKNKTQQIQQS